MHNTYRNPSCYKIPIQSAIWLLTKDICRSPAKMHWHENNVDSIRREFVLLQPWSNVRGRTSVSQSQRWSSGIFPSEIDSKFARSNCVISGNVMPRYLSAPWLVLCYISFCKRETRLKLFLQVVISLLGWGDYWNWCNSSQNFFISMLSIQRCFNVFDFNVQHTLSNQCRVRKWKRHEKIHR